MLIVRTVRWRCLCERCRNPPLVDKLQTPLSLEIQWSTACFSLHWQTYRPRVTNVRTRPAMTPLRPEAHRIKATTTTVDSQFSDDYSYRHSVTAFSDGLMSLPSIFRQAITRLARNGRADGHVGLCIAANDVIFTYVANLLMIALQKQFPSGTGVRTQHTTHCNETGDN